MRAPLILVHGFLGSCEDWKPVLDCLPNDQEGHAPILPGHAGIPLDLFPGPHTFDAAVGWLASTVEAYRSGDLNPHQGGGPCDVLGYSMGGRLALGLMIERPDLVRRVVAVGASAGIEDLDERAARAALDEQRAREIEEGPFEAWLERWYAQPLFDGLRDTQGFEALLARRRQGQPRALAEALRMMTVGRQPPLGHRLAETEVPLLLMAGSEDAKYTASNSALAARSPSIQAVTVPGAGHAPHLEQPDEFSRLLRLFLK